MRAILRSRARRPDRVGAGGFSLIELLIAIVVLLVGVVAVAQLVPVAIRTDLRNRNDSSALIIAQRQLEQMTAQALDAGNPAANGNYFFINTFLPLGTTPTTTVDLGVAPASLAAALGAPPPAPTTRGANLVANTLNIDWTQGPGGVPLGYRNEFRTPEGFRYETRWNITTFFRNASGVIQPVAKRIIISTQGGEAGQRLLPATVVVFVTQKTQ